MPQSSSFSSGFPKIWQSNAIFASGETITEVNVSLNGNGTFRIFIGTSDSIGGTITWEEISQQNLFITLTNQNVVLYCKIVGSNTAELFPSGIVPAITIERRIGSTPTAGGGSAPDSSEDI